ncbi:MAG: hypothetical protein J5858_08290, partial [Lentisphaeria bacterium]|nr:hypothetical protein [Lentisphaeria bacterium]
RSIYTKKQNFKSMEKQLPAILHSVWRSPEGKKALFLGNYTGKEQPFEFGKISGSLLPRSWQCVPLDASTSEHCFPEPKA